MPSSQPFGPLPSETLVLRTDTNALLEYYMANYLQTHMTLYDIGCGAKPFAPFLKNRVKQHIGIDIEAGFYGQSAVDIIGSADDVPVADETADATLSSQVIEHVQNPLKAIDEAIRILKPGGYLFLSFPFLYPLHALPYDFWRLSKYTAQDALTARGMTILHTAETGGFWYCMGFYIGLYLQNFDRGILKTTRLVAIISWLLRKLCWLGHHAESFFARLCGKDVQNMRLPWVVNYVFVARKQPHD